MSARVLALVLAALLTATPALAAEATRAPSPGCLIEPRPSFPNGFGCETDLVDAGAFARGRAAYNNKDYATALEILLPFAQRGDPVAQSFIGEMYHQGEGTTVDNNEAVKWFSLAAQQGNAYAEWRLGTLYQRGFGVAQDYTKAFEWFSLSAAQGNPLPQLEVAIAYATGRGVEKDVNKAVKWFAAAAAQNDRAAQYFLGMTYLNGEGHLARDEKEAVRLLTLSAAQGFSLAQARLGTVYGNGLYGVAKDDNEAVRLFSLAAAQGDGEGQLNLGIAYTEGTSIPRDYVRAYMWMSLAIAQPGGHGIEERGRTEGRRLLAVLANSMTAEQVSEAQTLATQCKALNYKDCK